MSSLSTMTSEFVSRISVAVWIGRITEEAAREALVAYAAACQQIDRMEAGRVQETILAEYRHRREGQDLCS
jgi:hypothetical protein